MPDPTPLSASDTAPKIGSVSALAPHIQSVLAPNASPMTHWGTNSYLIGGESVVIIDPGPASEDHLAALLKAIDGREVAGIFVTHSHLDHSPLAAPLAARTQSKTYGFGNSTAGRSRRMQALAKTGAVAGGEGVDVHFAPDITLADGEMFSWSDHSLIALHTPGHFCNHLSFRFGTALFSGDHVMGWASTLISPPDGDLTQYLASLRRLQGIGLQRLYPGHGAPVNTPETTFAAQLAHRQNRTEQILAALTPGPQTLPALTAKVYHNVAPMLRAAASRNTFAHLIDLYDKNLISASEPLSVHSEFSKK